MGCDLRRRHRGDFTGTGKAPQKVLLPGIRLVSHNARCILEKPTHMNDTHGRDRPVITEEMVKAATSVLWESGRLYSIAEGTDELIVRKMLSMAFLHLPNRQDP